MTLRVRKWNCAVCRGIVLYDIRAKTLWCKCGTVKALNLDASTILEQFRPFRPRTVGEKTHAKKAGLDERDTPAGAVEK